MRDHYDAATEGPRRSVTSTPHVVHYARGCAAFKGAPATHDRCHDCGHLMVRFFIE
jgi:hypothetical protein